MSENVCSEQELIEFFKKDFVPIDNIPEDTARREAICMEARASLLIEANCTGDRFPAFMESGSHTPLGWVYELSPKYTLKFTSSRCPVPLTLSFDKFLIANNRVGVDSGSSIVNRWRLYPSDALHARVLEQGLLFGNMSDWDKEIQPVYEQAKNEFDREYRSRFQLCTRVSPYKTPETICRFWGNRADIFADLKLSGMRPSNFSASEILDRDEYVQSDCTEEQQIQSYLERLIPCSTLNAKQTTLPNKYYEDWFCQVFPFRNEYGEIRMQLIKFYDPESQSKTLIPVTSWMRSQFPYNQCFCVPLPEDRQPLYNLDLLVKKETETVILTDSVELADSNQRHAPNGVVFTSFLCSPGRYDQVDWTPLRNMTIYYFIANHSGISPETAILKAKGWKDCMGETEPAIHVKFIFGEVDYNLQKHRFREFKSIDDVLTQHRENPPSIISDSVCVLESKDEFKELCDNAEALSNLKPKKVWHSSASGQEETCTTEKEDNEKSPIDYVMRPILIRGEATMLFARKSTGKSALSYSIAARIIAADASDRPVPLLREKWWTVPQRGHKVLYLDFENQNQIEQKQKLFQDSYFPKDKQKECYSNLIMKDLSTYSKDFSAPGNQQEVLDMIEAAKNEGTPGLPIDLLIIDTYTGFVQTETPATPGNFKLLVNKIRAMRIAVLVVHHANADDEAGGFKSKLYPFGFTFRIYRDDNKPGDLEEQPISVEYGDIRGEMGSELRKPFKIQYNNKNHQWNVVNPVRDENAELKLIVKDYMRCGYKKRSTLEAMIGLKKSALDERIGSLKKL